MLRFLQHQVSTSLWCLRVCSEQFECALKHLLLLWISLGRVRTMPLRPAKTHVAEVLQYCMTGLTLQSDMSPKTDGEGWKLTEARFKKQTKVKFLPVKSNPWLRLCITGKDEPVVFRAGYSNCKCFDNMNAKYVTSTENRVYQSTMSSKQATRRSTWRSLTAGNQGLISLKSGRNNQNKHKNKDAFLFKGWTKVVL